MAKAPIKETTTIEIPRLEIDLIEIDIVGDTPLVTHAWSAKAKKEMLDKQMKKPKGPKVAKDPNRDFEESIYRLEDGGYGMPSVAFKNAMITAVTSVSGLTKVGARQSFHVVGEGVDLSGAFEGVQMRMNLVRIQGAGPRMREDCVRIAMGTADLRYRPEYWPWWAKILVRFDANLLSAAQLMNLINRAGFGVGVGEWRAEKDGEFGQFHVAGEGEVDRLVAAMATKGGES